MGLVEISEVVSAPVSRVWDAINDVESYPRVMEHVRSLTVVERGPDYRVIAWEADFKGCLMKWVEREQIDAEKYRIEYRQIKGDLAAFEGHWQLEPLTDTTCRVLLTVRFEIGIPMLGDMLNPVVEKVIGGNSRKMVLALGSLAAAQAARESVPEAS